jgi:hypothetical protein
MWRKDESVHDHQTYPTVGVVGVGRDEVGLFFRTTAVQRTAPTWDGV